MTRTALAASFLLLGALSCYDEPTTGGGPCVVTTDGSGVQTQILYAGQHIEAGTVSVAVAGEDLVITYDTIDGWEITETHVWVGTDLADMPQTPTGNPKIGLFPYGDDTLDHVTTWSLTIPLADLGFSCPSDDLEYLVAAHAALEKDDGSGGTQTETGWAAGQPLVLHGSWATYFGFTLSCDCAGDTGTPGEETCETMFAYGGDAATCFLDLDLDGDGTRDFSRWGWTNAIGAGTWLFPLYAAAGQCVLENGTQVGEVAIDYDGSTLTAEYLMFDGFLASDTHLYAGADPVPQDHAGNWTVAPGQFPYASDDGTFEVTDLSGDLNVIAHGVACGVY